MIAAPRQSGRTTTMLCYAANAAHTQPVVVIFHNHAEAQRRSREWCHPSAHGTRFVSAEMFLSSTMHLQPCLPFVDHAVWELCPRHVQEALIDTLEWQWGKYPHE